MHLAILYQMYHHQGNCLISRLVPIDVILPVFKEHPVLLRPRSNPTSELSIKRAESCGEWLSCDFTQS